MYLEIIKIMPPVSCLGTQIQDTSLRPILSIQIYGWVEFGIDEFRCCTIHRGTTGTINISSPPGRKFPVHLHACRWRMRGAFERSCSRQGPLERDLRCVVSNTLTFMWLSSTTFRWSRMYEMRASIAADASGADAHCHWQSPPARDHVSLLQSSTYKCIELESNIVSYAAAVLHPRGRTVGALDTASAKAPNGTTSSGRAGVSAEISFPSPYFASTCIPHPSPSDPTR